MKGMVKRWRVPSEDSECCIQSPRKQKQAGHRQTTESTLDNVHVFLTGCHSLFAQLAGREAEGHRAESTHH